MNTWRTDLNSPIGAFVIVSSATGVVATRRQDDPSLADLPTGDPHNAADAYAAWFGGEFAPLERMRLDLQGTPFQRDIWTALRFVPFSCTTTYGMLAEMLDRPAGAARAIGGAVGANPIVIAVPCHRVLGSDGSLTGFAWGLAAKRWLLRHEGHDVPGEQLGLF